MKYVEKGMGYSHSVGYEYDDINNLTALVDTINGTEYKTSYAYDDDNRVTSVTAGTASRTYGYDDWGNIHAVSGKLSETLGESNPLRYRGYVYDTETGLYYVSSRYSDPEMGRFINADGLVTTGQGLLGNNMFTYCNNNPVVSIDHNGNSPQIILSEYAGEVGKIIGEWIADIVMIDENDTDDQGNRTTNANIKRIAKAIIHNTDLSVGIGQGLYLERTLFELIGVGGGIYANYIVLSYENGKFKMGQEYNTGFSSSLFFHNYGYTEYMFNEFTGDSYFRGELETSKGFYGADKYIISSGAAYFIVGGSYRIEFDIIGFLNEISD